MGFIFRKKVGGRNAWLNLSKSGASGSVRLGPFTFNSRGRGSMRILPGISYRFGGRKRP